MRITALFLSLAFIVSACATPTPYGPATKPEGYGFSEQQIEANRFRITFRGNSSTSRETVESYLLYRAATLTLQEGYDYFIVVESDTETQKKYSVTDYYPAFYGRYPYPMHHGYYSFPYYAYGFGWGYPYEANIRELTRYSAVTYITLHKGAKPADNPQAFDAREVEENLRPGIQTAGIGG